MLRHSAANGLRLCQGIGHLLHREAALITADPPEWHSLPCLECLTHFSPLAQSRGFAADAARAVQPAEQGLRQDQTWPVFNLDGERIGEQQLPGTVFDVPIRRDILQRVVQWQLARRQQGTHSVKSRAEVRGGGRKPHPQKGTGRARQGSIRSPQFKGGGVVHGPVPRPHAYKLNRKVVRLGLQCALSAKAAEGRLHLVDTLLLREAKTQALDKHLNALLAGAPQLNPERPRRSVLLVDSGKQAPDGGDSIRQAAGNLPWVDVIPSEGLNVYSILQRDQLLMTAQAVQLLTQRVQQPIKR